MRTFLVGVFSVFLEQSYNISTARLVSFSDGPGAAFILMFHKQQQHSFITLIHDFMPHTVQESS